MNHWMPVSGSDIYFALEIFGIIYALAAIIWFSRLLYIRIIYPAYFALKCWNAARKYRKQFPSQYRRFIK